MILSLTGDQVQRLDEEAVKYRPLQISIIPKPPFDDGEIYVVELDDVPTWLLESADADGHQQISFDSAMAIAKDVVRLHHDILLSESVIEDYAKVVSSALKQPMDTKDRYSAYLALSNRARDETTSRRHFIGVSKNGLLELGAKAVDLGWQSGVTFSFVSSIYSDSDKTYNVKLIRRSGGLGHSSWNWMVRYDNDHTSVSYTYPAHKFDDEV